MHVDERGTVSIYDEISWNKLHKFKNNDISPCTSFAIYDNDIVSVGEDGYINLLTALKRSVVRTIGIVYLNDYVFRSLTQLKYL